tara:strand:- start:2065 stop:2277 length:213 start_codon:yes stop_codon:yes gene_type:complete
MMASYWDFIDSKSKRVAYIGRPTWKGYLSGIPENLKGILFMKDGREVKVWNRGERKKTQRKRGGYGYGRK